MLVSDLKKIADKVERYEFNGQSVYILQSDDSPLGSYIPLRVKAVVYKPQRRYFHLKGYQPTKELKTLEGQIKHAEETKHPLWRREFDAMEVWYNPKGYCETLFYHIYRQFSVKSKESMDMGRLLPIKDVYGYGGDIRIYFKYGKDGSKLVMNDRYKPYEWISSKVDNTFEGILDGVASLVQTSTFTIAANCLGVLDKVEINPSNLNIQGNTINTTSLSVQTEDLKVKLIDKLEKILADLKKD